MNEQKEKHESYGMIKINRFLGGSRTYFGSSIKHSGGISIGIYEAEIDRHLHKDWFHHNHVPIVEVQMSYNQFAEMLTANINTSGTPCTITYKNSKRIESPNFVNKRLQFEEEFKKDTKELNNKLENLIKDSKNLLSSSKPLNKKEKESILNQILRIQQEISSNMPFLSEQFNKQIDKTVSEAKGEIEGFYESKIRNLGIEALQNKVEVPEIE